MSWQTENSVPNSKKTMPPLTINWSDVMATRTFCNTMHRHYKDQLLNNITQGKCSYVKRLLRLMYVKA